jgi:arylsulfatase A-like enzyme
MVFQEMVMKQFATPVAIGALCAQFAVSAPAPAADNQKMNVLLIIADDQRTELGCYASTMAKTPNLDRLAATGMRFDRAYCQYPLCNPSRASMLTGRHPASTGVLGNRTWFGDAHPDFVSLPKYFKNHGYASIRVGKIFHGGIDDTEAWSENGQIRTLAGVPAPVPGEKKAKAAPDAADPDETMSPVDLNGPPLTKTQRSDRWVVLKGMGEEHGDYKTADRTIEYLRDRKNKNEPFFIGCGFVKPHSPPEAPQAFYDQWDVDKIPLPPDFAPRPTVPEGFPAGCIRPRNADLFIGRDASPAEARQMIRGYLASSAWMDWNVGRVLAELDAQGLREKTIVIFWGDHGYQLGEKGKWSKAGSLWEQGTRTPFFICDPRLKDKGKNCTRVVQMVDLYPTLVDLCGLPPAVGLEGRSLAPLLNNPAAPWDYPAFTTWSEDGRYFTGVMVRTERWRYAEYYGRGAGAMLLEPDKDAHELVNLANDPKYADVVAQLSALVKQYAAGHTPPAP